MVCIKDEGKLKNGSRGRAGGMSLMGIIVHPQGNGNFRSIGDVQLQNGMRVGWVCLWVRSAVKKKKNHQGTRGFICHWVLDPPVQEQGLCLEFESFLEVSSCLKIRWEARMLS